METVRPLLGIDGLRRYGLAIIIAMTGLAILSAVFYITYQRESQVIIKGIYVDKINLAGYTLSQAERTLEEQYKGKFTKAITLKNGDFQLSFVPSDVGFELDSQGLAREAFGWGHEGSFFRRGWERVKVRLQNHSIPLRVHIRKGAVGAFYHLLEDEVNREPVSTKVFLLQGGRVRCTPSGDGRRLNLMLLQKRIIDAIWTGKQQIVLPIETTRPSLTLQQVKTWSLTNVIAIFSTRFNPGNIDRSHNVALASSSLQNVLVLPGNEFSFNSVVGSRVSEQGYREAPVIIKNKLTPGVGGGVCQVSSTLYNALLLAGFTQIGRRNHSLPSTYVPLGRDATVVDGAVDLTFVNTLLTPVLLVTDFNPSGWITVAVLGKKEFDEKIRLESVIKKKIPFTSVEMIDPALALGERKVEEEGKDGYIVELWRIRRGEDGKVLREKVNQSYYPPIPALIKVGPSPEHVSEEALSPTVPGNGEAAEVTKDERREDL